MVIDLSLIEKYEPITIRCDKLTTAVVYDAIKALRDNGAFSSDYHCVLYNTNPDWTAYAFYDDVAVVPIYAPELPVLAVITTKRAQFTIDAITGEQMLWQPWLVALIKEKEFSINEQKV